ncbi:MAG: RagB/SusD family nutrient uptake outer membrane protein [Prevotellaceae bacterium]|nr:RagB/SusD family nutrient uptake outer membrane protein [Prevotellaceae bacterium]
MKKIIQTLLIAAALTSCNKLDLEPDGAITTGQFFQTETDAVAAINGVYQSLTYTAGEQALYGRNLYFLTDMGTDYAAAGASASNFHVQSISKLSIDENNDRVALVWKQLYNGINRANIAIDNIPKVNGDETLKARLRNEAKFIRALLYYNAVRLWSDVPLVLHAPDELDSKTLKVGRTPKEEVYAQIISDLTDAQSLPPTYAAADKGRPTSGSAYALLADVYLTRKDYSNATKTAKYIIDNASTWGYQLVDNFGDLFAKYDKKNGPEHIFSVQFEDGQGGTPGASGQTLTATSYYGPSGVEPPDVSSSDDVVYNRFAEGDTRKGVSYIKYVINENGDTAFTFPRALFIKYVPDLSIIYRTHPVNFPVIRYSEVLLIYAEALNEENATPPAEAYEAINQVRRRAFGELPYATPSSKSGVDLSELDKEGFRKAVQDERLFEFVQEGKRWFDLVRWGILEEAIKDVTYNGQKIKSAVSKRSYLYPIPQEQRDLNPVGLWQNTGYGE